MELRNTHNLFTTALDKALGIASNNRMVYFADSSKGAGGAQNTDGVEKNLTPAQELEKRQRELDAQTNSSMGAKIQELPSSVRETAKSKYESGTLMEKTLVIQLTEGHISADMFNKLIKCLGGDKNHKTLAEKHITKDITSTAFEVALIGLDKKDEEAMKLVTQLEKGKISGQAFSNAIEKSKKKIMGKADQASPLSTDSTVARTQEKLNLVNQSLTQRLSTKIGTPKDQEILRGFVGEFGETTTKLTSAYDSMDALYKEMSGGHPAIYTELKSMIRKQEYVGEYALPEPMRESEASIPADVLADALKKVGAKFKVNLEPYGMRFYTNVSLYQSARIEVAKVEKKIGLLLLPINKEVEARIMIDQRLEEIGKGLGIELKEGTKLRHLDIRPDGKGGNEYFWAEGTEILAIGFEKPDKEVDPETLKIMPEEGMMLVIVTGAGTFTESTLKKWMDATRASQDIKAKPELEKVIGFEEFGGKLEAGTKLEFDRNKDIRTDGMLRIDTEEVTVQSISNDKVVLDRPVTILYQEESQGRHIADFEKQDMQVPEKDMVQQEFTYGEFAKWMLQKDARKAMTIAEASAAIENLQKQAGYAETQPITSGAIFCDPTGKNVMKVESVDPVKNTIVVNDNGTRYTTTPAAHYETAKKRNLMKGDPETFAKEAMKSIDPNDPEVKAEMEKIARAQEEHTRKALEVKPEHVAAAEAEKKEPEPLKADPCTLPPMSKIKKYWDNTTFLCLEDTGHLIKSIYEWWTRKWKRNMEFDTGKVGEGLPLVSAEMARMKEHAEHEEVEKYKSGLEHLGVYEIREIMWHAKYVDELKACMLILVNKGQARWDDINLWKAINRFTKPEKRIPIPDDGDPQSIVKIDPTTGAPRTGQDLIEGAVDAMWGEGIFGKWFNENNSAYTNGCNAYKVKGDLLENDPKGIGGLRAEMQKLLRNFKNGGWVNPQQYEGLFQFSIEKGKLTAEDKLYFLVQGVATNLMGMDRIGFADGNLLNHMPWLDYFTQGKEDWKFGKPHTYPDGVEKYGEPYPPPGQREGKSRPFKWKDIRFLASYLDNDPGKKDCQYGPRTKEVLWKHILQDYDSRIRIDKALQQSERLDHDDIHFIVPFCSEAVVERLCGTGGTTREHFSLPGYLNAFPGYNHRLMNALTLEDPNKSVQEITEGLVGFARYDGILDNRYKKDQAGLMRIDKVRFNVMPVVDVNITRAHREQLQRIIMDVGKAYGKDFNILFKDLPPLKGASDVVKAEQEKVEISLANFKEDIETLVASDNGAKLLQVVSGYKMLGQGGEKRDEAFLKKNCYWR
ncbi:MAG: hypothetical protein UT33_C0015G0033 [Candidatus Peregrinibacteria bacterium GW2011_GWC2_39_14]|nr:MAG: hypothetical protein US92_C0009G0015 [Candidatus Peregrinibacteria bacterium GW2011_GWA2_38_36]KKR04976.1 MAG: hypothetical protein UT33_C0015G0033 [Candidatus Peregrinibacteria bacterium GW2011_GWC2_39_14]